MFQAEMNIRRTDLLFFTQIMIRGAKYWQIKTCFLHNTVMTLKHIYNSAWFVNKDILMFASHKKLHMYSISDAVNLLDSSPGAALLWVTTLHKRALDRV